MPTTTAARPTTCARCAAPFPKHEPGYCGGTGYAWVTDGQAVCYPCADKEQAADLANPETTRYSVCVSSDGFHITTWTGGLLGYATWHKNGSKDYRRWISPCTVSYRVRTPDGRLWHGRGAGAGMCLNLRVMKGR